MLSFLQNVTGSITEWLQLEPLPTIPKVTKGSLESKSKSPSPVQSEDDMNAQSEDATDNSNTIYISDWLPPEPFHCKEFTGMPT